MTKEDERRFQNTKRRIIELEERIATLEKLSHPPEDLGPYIQQEIEKALANFNPRPRRYN